MPDERILVTRSSMPTLEEYVNEIAPLWDSHFLTNMGEKHQQLERDLLEVPSRELGHCGARLPVGKNLA